MQSVGTLIRRPTVEDPETYLTNLRSDGYATSQKYVQNNMDVIKKYDLTKFDKTEDIKEEQKMGFKVLIDPGHYSATYNKSTTGVNYYESAMTLKLAGYLKTELEKRGVEVKLSRNSINENPSLYNRGYSAKGYNLFLSLHSNACGAESVDYPVVIRGYDKSSANDFAQKMANMIASLMETRQAGKVMTKKGSSGGEYFGVLRGAREAGLTYYYIIEHSFHTNYNATKWLSDDNNLKNLAVKEAELICSYFNITATTQPSTPTVSQPVASGQMYRVRKTWADVKSQIGAYTVLANAKANCPSGYCVYDKDGKEVYSNKPAATVTSESYLVKITADVLNVRAGAGTGYKVTTTVKKNQVYTIVAEQSGWGKLKSGAGWISLKYTTKC